MIAEPEPEGPYVVRAGFDGEQWVGQRGLLAVGVIAVVLAAGYLLKLSFDRGWVSPMVRCLSGGATGIAIAIAGWVIDRRGYRTYGPALMGLGTAITYTVIWAASVWYQFIPQTQAVLGRPDPRVVPDPEESAPGSSTAPDSERRRS